MSTDEYASLTKENNEDGTVRTTFFDASLQRTKAKAGYAILEQYYNENGALTAEAYFDVDGNPTPLTDDAYVRFELLTCEDGSVQKNFYDAAGNVVKTEE